MRKEKSQNERILYSFACLYMYQAIRNDDQTPLRNCCNRGNEMFAMAGKYYMCHNISFYMHKHFRQRHNSFTFIESSIWAIYHLSTLHQFNFKHTYQIRSLG